MATRLQYENNSEIGVFSELTNANCLVAIDVEERLSALGNIPFSYNGHAALTHLDLDREKEEDEYDDVAVGTEQHAGDCLYMKDVKIVEYDDIEELDTHCELLNSLRANPVADKEDAEAYANCDTSLISGNVDAGDYNGEELDVKHPKPILKKGGKLTEKTSKRVRFLCEPEDENVDQHSSDSSDFNFMLFRGLFNE